MIAAWIVYAMVVGVLLGAGAMVLETLLRAHRLPTRWVWAGSMALTLFWPLGHLLVRHWPREAAPVPLPDPARIVVLDPLAVQVTPESFLRSLDAPILGLWVLASLVLLGSFAILISRTRRMRREWKGAEAGGQPVLFSRDLGPAVVGFFRPEIVLPGWCRELEDQTLSLILDHEVEHLRAGDLRLILTAGILPIILPWHLPLWWQLKRLRLAAEGDCDLRVLKKHPERTRPYLELLLEVGGMAPRARALVAMLSEPEETLERRIRIMTMPFPKKPWVRGLLLTTVGSLLVAMACWAPGPNDVAEEEAEVVQVPPEIQVPGTPSKEEAELSPEIEVPASPPTAAGSELSAAPTFTPYTVRPDIKNRAEVARALEREYPPLLKDASIGGTVLIWFFLDEAGRVQRLMVNESSGHKALDDAALRVGAVIEFTPAMNRDKEVPVWISLPITFRTAPKTPEPPSEISGTDISAAPTFTPYTVRPDIKNRAEIARALEEAYPPALRDEGIGGTVQVWFFIDERGVVQKTQVNESSGHQAIDDAALEVAGKIDFTPAMNEDKAVPVWISLPITFTTR